MSVHDDISNSADLIDSRDIIARIDELTSDRDAFDSDEGSTWETDNEDDAAELKILLALQDDAEGYAPDWRHGATLIRDSYFEQYARDMAEDCGLLQKGATWPYTCIDWERAATELQYDYTSIEYDDVTYWIQ